MKKWHKFAAVGVVSALAIFFRKRGQFGLIEFKSGSWVGKQGQLSLFFPELNLLSYQLWQIDLQLSREAGI